MTKNKLKSINRFGDEETMTVYYRRGKWRKTKTIIKRKKIG